MHTEPKAIAWPSMTVYEVEKFQSFGSPIITDSICLMKFNKDHVEVFFHKSDKQIILECPMYYKSPYCIKYYIIYKGQLQILERYQDICYLLNGDITMTLKPFINPHEH